MTFEEKGIWLITRRRVFCCHHLFIIRVCASSPTPPWWFISLIIIIKKRRRRWRWSKPRYSHPEEREGTPSFYDHESKQRLLLRAALLSTLCSPSACARGSRTRAERRGRKFASERRRGERVSEMNIGSSRGHCARDSAGGEIFINNFFTFVVEIATKFELMRSKLKTHAANIMLLIYNMSVNFVW